MAGRSATIGRLVLAGFVAGVGALGVMAWTAAPATGPPVASRAAPPVPVVESPGPEPPVEATVTTTRAPGLGEPEPALVLTELPPPAAPSERTIARDADGSAFNAADPALVRDGSTWRVFTTQDTYVNVPTWASSDGVTWEPTGDALPTLPDWAAWGLTWAPDVVEIDGTWILFFSALVADTDRHCIGHAVATDATGPYTPFATPIVCELDEGGSIDPSVFADADGSYWLLWKVDANAIDAPSVLRSQRLDVTGTALLGEASDLLHYGAPGEWPLIEQPEMVLVDDEHHLLYSAGWFNQPSYQIRHARCDGPAGPCRRSATEPWVASEVGIEGPGAMSVEPFGDGHVAVYHAWLDGFGDGRFRSMVLARIGFENGRPHVAGG